jgi:ABC-type transporter Mla MlaB component
MRSRRNGNAAEHLVVYQHDGAESYRFVLVGKLDGAYVDELKSAWVTASSMLRGRELIFDLSALEAVDDAGLEFLSRMRESGARIVPVAAQGIPTVPETPAPPVDAHPARLTAASARS